MNKEIKICCTDTLQFPFYCLFCLVLSEIVGELLGREDSMFSTRVQIPLFHTAVITMNKLLANYTSLIFSLAEMYSRRTPLM